MRQAASEQAGGQIELGWAILDSIEHEIAVIRKSGEIVYVNQAWVRFGLENGLPPVDWRRANYLHICAEAARSDDAGVREACRGIAEVLNGHHLSFTHEYPCHSPQEQRWFLMTVVGLVGQAEELFVISHSNITQRKLIEQQLEILSRQDPLTGLANRRHFMDFLGHEWARGLRTRQPLSLVMFDIDDFKAVNDRHGHVIGDICLKAMAGLIAQSARRPGDLAVRWGGEEFILILGQTGMPEATRIAERVVHAAAALQATAFGPCTLSAGVSTGLPGAFPAERLIQAADSALYRAKRDGKNRVVVHPGVALSTAPMPG